MVAPAATPKAIQQRILDADDRALLAYWYKRDDNAVPPAYCLQPRTGEFTDFANWELIEHQLRSILLQATALLNLTTTERLKYTASATEQEIAQGALEAVVKFITPTDSVIDGSC